MTAGASIEANVLVEAVRGGSARAIGRAVSRVENGGAAAEELVRALFPLTGNARLVGLTGPPGAGKSTLVDQLAKRCRVRGDRVAILAVDPTSPYTGGALLGDRVRMQELYTDRGVFIRSMATRGALGGLAEAAHDAIDVLDAAGFDWVFVETVGVGQDEVDVVRAVDSVVLVTLPGLGDDVQAIKAGVLEIADLFALNKSDRDGVDRAERDLDLLLEGRDPNGWMPPVVRTVATTGDGVDELLGEIERHRSWSEETGDRQERRRERYRIRVERILRSRVLRAAEQSMRLAETADRAVAEGSDPYRLAGRLFDELAGGAFAVPAVKGGRE